MGNFFGLKFFSIAISQSLIEAPSRYVHHSTFRLFCGGCKGKSSFLKYLQGSHEKKSISKNSLGHEVFSHKKIFFLRPVLSPLRRREPKELFPKKTLKMVLNDASQKAMFVWDKTFFFTSMKKVRVSFSVFFFFLRKSLLQRFFGSKKIPSWKQAKKSCFWKSL